MLVRKRGGLWRFASAIVVCFIAAYAIWWEAGASVEASANSEVTIARAAVDASAAGLRTTILAALRHLHGVASVIAADNSVVEYLKAGYSKNAVLNIRLAEFANDLSVEVVWLLNSEGLCIAASNAGHEESFVGIKYHDRIYYKEAARGAKGFQYAVGRKSNRPGLYFSAPIYDDGAFIGVIVVKVDLPTVSWLHQTAGIVFDTYGVAILASDRSVEHTAMPDARVRALNSHVVNEIYKRTQFPPLIQTPMQGWPDAFTMNINNKPAVVVLGKSAITEYGLSVSTYREVPALESRIFDRQKRAARHGILALLFTFGVFFAYRILRKSRQEGYFDDVTGLPNEVLFRSAASIAAAGSARRQQSLALIYISRDKSAQQQRPWSSVACSLRSLLRASDMAGRLLAPDVIGVLVELEGGKSEAENCAHGLVAKIQAALGKGILLDHHVFAATELEHAFQLLDNRSTEGGRLF